MSEQSNDLSKLYDAILKGDAGAAVQVTESAIAQKADPQELLTKYMIPAMDEVGRRFEANEYFVPELLFSARAMSAAVDAMRPQLVGGGYEPAGKVVMGTVRGDLHDIGKRLVSMMLEGCGFEVVDLGADVAPERFVEAARESGAKLVGLSTLLTTMLPTMEATVSAIRQAGLAGAVRIMVGGAPVTESFAQQIGADGYAPDASSAAVLARRLVGLPARPSDAP